MPTAPGAVKSQLLIRVEINHRLVAPPLPAYHLTMPVQARQLRIRTYPDPALRAPGQPVETVDEHVRQVAQRMLELMHEANGIGLAAPQVGLDWHLFVANPTGDPDNDRVFINPALRDADRHTELYEEGCLSLPGVTGQVMRPVSITIDAINAQGEPFSLTDDGLAARCWQHEYDHLDGILIIDRMPPADRRANKRPLRELEQR